MTTGRFIPTSEIRRLSEGSYEHIVFQVDHLVKENVVRLFGGEMACELVGTFPTSALVLSEDGQLVRVKFERAENGVLKLVSHGPEKVSVFTASTVEEFARKEIRRAVQAWREGRVEEAQRIIAEVAPYVDARPVREDHKIVESLIVAYRAPRPWKQLHQKRGGRIRGTLGDAAILELQESSPRPKFGPLHDGSLQESERLGYSDLLYTDFEYLRSRVESLRDLVEESYEPLGRVVRSEEFKDEEAITTFAIFTEDLISDLRRLHQVVADAPKQIMKIESLARLYDAIVEGWSEYEIAGKFVETMSKRLQEAAAK